MYDEINNSWKQQSLVEEEVMNEWTSKNVKNLKLPRLYTEMELNFVWGQR